MLKTIVLLILALVGLPLVAYYLDPSLTDAQWHLIKVGGGSAVVVATICFLLAEITGNCSQVDKIWSVVPIIYVWEYAHYELSSALCFDGDFGYALGSTSDL